MIPLIKVYVVYLADGGRLSMRLKSGTYGTEWLNSSPSASIFAKTSSRTGMDIACDSGT